MEGTCPRDFLLGLCLLEHECRGKGWVAAFLTHTPASPFLGMKWVVDFGENCPLCSEDRGEGSSLFLSFLIPVLCTQ